MGPEGWGEGSWLAPILLLGWAAPRLTKEPENESIGRRAGRKRVCEKESIIASLFYVLDCLVCLYSPLFALRRCLPFACGEHFRNLDRLVIIPQKKMCLHFSA